MIQVSIVNKSLFSKPQAYLKAIPVSKLSHGAAQQRDFRVNGVNPALANSDWLNGGIR
jgi:hypothetical protein